MFRVHDERTTMDIEKEQILKELLDKVIEDEGLKNPEVIIKPISTAGANYSSTLYTIAIKQPGREDLQLFAKIACIGEHIREAMKAERFFATERFVYKDLKKIYEELQILNKIPEGERLTFPKFYACSDKRFDETLILENLVAKGFTLYDRFKSVTWEYATAAMTELAKLHALSYAFMEDNPEKFAEVIVEREMVFSGSKEELQKTWKKSEDNAVNVLPEDKKEKFRAFVTKESGMDGYRKYLTTTRRPVLLHGDYRPSNLLHRMKDGKLEKLIPVDYQTMHDGSPICDILYFIFSGTDGYFRKHYFKPLIDHYYTTFANFLIKLGLNPKIIYPKVDFDADFKKSLPFGLLFSILLLPIILVEEENAPTLDGDASVSDLAIKPNEIYKERFLEIFEEYERWGIV